MKDDGRLVTVDIRGLRYPIRSHLDPAYVADLAAYVEHKMELATRESPAGDTLKIAVLAALNIADEYFRAHQEGASHRSDLTQRALELERMLDLALGSPNPLDASLDAPADAPVVSALARTAGSF
jgi:cell division protein ZapA